MRGLHGLRGVVRVEVLTDRPEDRFAPGRVLHREGTAAALTIVAAGPVEDAEGTVIELHVAEDDMGKVIGRNGSVAKALRTLLKVTAARDGGSVTLEIL